jgi:CRP-like cAMP-binding protein
MDKREVLKQHIGKFVTIGDDQLDYFVSYFQEHTYKKRQVIIGEGDRVDKEYFVLSGCLKAFYINDETKMYILKFAMPTWWTSDYSALYNSTRASINIDCITDAETPFLRLYFAF